MCDETRFCLFNVAFIIASNLLPSVLGSRLIRLSLPGFKHFLSSYRFTLVVVRFQELTDFILKITVYFCVYGFGTMSPLLKLFSNSVPQIICLKTKQTQDEKVVPYYLPNSMIYDQQSNDH